MLDLSRAELPRSPGAVAYAETLAGALPAAAPEARVTVLRPGETPPPEGADVALGFGRAPRFGSLRVVAVTDVSHLFDRGRYGAIRRLRLSLAGSRAVREADLAIAPSAFVAGALRRYLRLPVSRVAVVPPGLPAGFARAERKDAEAFRVEAGIPGRYFSAAVPEGPGPELTLLLSAWAQAARGLAGVTLVLAGAPARASFPEGVMALPRLPRDRMPAFLSGAIAHLDPRAYRGNPIGTLEAMRCGTPPLVATPGAGPEITQDAGMALPAGDPGPWAAALVLMATEAELRSGIGARARQLASEMTDQASARALVHHLSARVTA